MNASSGAGQDRRQFFRLDLNTPVEYTNFTARSKNPNKLQGASKNISATGVMFQTEAKPPQVSSLLWMDMDVRTLQICQEIERRALTVRNGIFGRVVRVEEDVTSHLYNVGVCFLTESDRSSTEAQNLIAELGL